ncbi:hypothetical protein [Paracoccus saliphilus]|nr:hypothetical protein [Paracoccus saliphilus]
MRKIAYIVMALFLALYGASTAAQAASASAMTIEMVTSAEPGMNMANCQACEIDEDTTAGGLACGMVCTPPLAATFTASIGPIMAPHLPQERPSSKILATGLTGSPDPFPPRTLI